jgi:cyclic pyranopterin phosphate synthase
LRTADISSKFVNRRYARAFGRIRLGAETLRLIREGKLPKGDVVEATKLAGILGAKRVPDILPFCHPVGFDFVEVRVELKEYAVEVFSEVRGTAKTGYEMEALTAVSTALLNIYDMCKGVDKEMVIEEVRLLEKGGGRSDWSTDLKGKKVSVLSEREDLKKVVLEFLKALGAQESEVAELKIVIGKSFHPHRRLHHLESVVAIYDFSSKPSFSDEGITIGMTDGGEKVVILPEDEERIRNFFNTFGSLLGDLLK